MARKTIFELYQMNNDMGRDFSRISLLEKSDKCVFKHSNLNNGYSIWDIFERGFREWKQRGRCISLSDYLATIDFKSIEAGATLFTDYLISYIELVYNAWFFADKEVQQHKTTIRWGYDGKELQRLMDEILSEMNQKAYYDPETEQCLIGEDSAQVTAAVEATEPETASQILHYNHRQLAGEISKKKIILQNLAKYLEGRESELKSINMQLFTDLNTAFNNLDIRHNNIVQRESFDYKEKLAQMPPEELEKWYDDVYQLILLAILEMDNVERRKRLRTLIQDINPKMR